MKEKIAITNKNGPIRIDGNKFDSALYLNNIPIQFTWIREVGTTWRYLISKNISESAIVRDTHFQNFVKHGYLSAENLSTQFKYILNQLSEGEYSLEIDYLPTEIYLSEIDADKTKYSCFDTYGGLQDILETQSTCDEKTVSEYVELINKGAQPIMVLLTCSQSNNTFILDGHHKYIAYNRLKKQPRAFIITKLDARKINREEGLSLLEMARCKNRNFVNVFLAGL